MTFPSDFTDEPKLSSQRQWVSACLTVNAGQHDPGVVVRDDISIAVLWFVDLQVGILPGELLAGVNRLMDTQKKDRIIKTMNGCSFILACTPSL